MAQSIVSDSRRSRREPRTLAVTAAAGCTVGAIGLLSRGGADESSFLSPHRLPSNDIHRLNGQIGGVHRTVTGGQLGVQTASTSSGRDHVGTFAASSVVAAAVAVVSSKRTKFSRRQVRRFAVDTKVMDPAKAANAQEGTPTKGATLEVSVYACGAPKRGMGWYHAEQLLDGRFGNAKLKHVVEPFWLDDSNSSPDFGNWQAIAEPQGVSFHKSVEDAPGANSSSVVLISGRTSDNPKFFQAALDKGFKNIILEKPGASTLAELSEMAQNARNHGAAVYMGYNRNFSTYVKKLVEKSAELQKQGKAMDITLGRNDCFPEDALDECFERNAEGMLANMMCHELMVLVTYFGLKASSIKEIKVDPSSCKKEVRRGHTDFRQMSFTLTLVDGRTFQLWGDRCGGEYCEALISVEGSEVFRALRPDPALEAMSKKLELEKPGCQPYFYLQDEEYLDLKNAIFSHIQEGKAGSPHGVASIDTALEAMKVIEVIQKQLEEAV